MSVGVIFASPYSYSEQDTNVHELFRLVNSRIDEQDLMEGSIVLVLSPLLPFLPRLAA